MLEKYLAMAEIEAGCKGATVDFLLDVILAERDTTRFVDLVFELRRQGRVDEELSVFTAAAAVFSVEQILAVKPPDEILFKLVREASDEQVVSWTYGSWSEALTPRLWRICDDSRMVLLGGLDSGMWHLSDEFAAEVAGWVGSVASDRFNEAAWIALVKAPKVCRSLFRLGHVAHALLAYAHVPDDLPSTHRIASATRPLCSPRSAACWIDEKRPGCSTSSMACSGRRCTPFRSAQR